MTAGVKRERKKREETGEQECKKIRTWGGERKRKVSDSFVLVSQKLLSRDHEDNQELPRSAHTHTACTGRIKSIHTHTLYKWDTTKYKTFTCTQSPVFSECTATIFH